VIVNLSRYTQPAELDLKEFLGYVPKEIFSNNKFPIIKDDGTYFFTLSAHDCQWFALDKVHPEIDRAKELPHVALRDWKEITSKRLLETLSQNILPNYMLKLRWFGGKGRVIEGMQIIQHASILHESSTTVILLIEVYYQSGLSEIYQLPVAFGKDALANKLRESCPQSVICNLTIGEEHGILYDALYGIDYQLALINGMAANQNIGLHDSEIRFYANHTLEKYVGEQEAIKPRVLGGEQSNTSLTFDNKFFLKLYRKVDRVINPDLEIAHYLTEHAHFQHVPTFVGAIEWRSGNDSIVLGMMQEMVESNSDAWTYMLDRLDDFNEKVLSLPDVPNLPSLRGTITDPVGYDQIPESLKDLIDATLAERARQIGIRTGEMHLALASGSSLPAFASEEYSLHYQRSLFSGLQSLVRGTFQNQARTLSRLPDEVRHEAEEVLSMKDDILKTFRNIYKHKIDVVKIRIHGDYHLGQVLFTGKDFILTDFEGEPARSYSERRLKRSPLRDIAGMVRSFHYAAYGSLFLDNQIRKEDYRSLIPYVEQWYHYMSGFFVKAYLDTVKGSPFIPKNKEDMDILMNTFLLEKAIYELNYELNNRPDWVIIPLRGIKAIMHYEEHHELEELATV
jgi:maltose alpha-D-glucosyltransferase/alpha-amylase